MLHYLLQDAVNVAEDIIVPESQNAITFGAKESISGDVFYPFLVLGMLATVKLDHQPLFEANEIGYVRPDWLLAPESGML